MVERNCLDLFGSSVLPAAMRVLVLLALSCCRFHPFGEIWNGLVLVLFVLHSLPALHVVCVAFLGSLIRLRFLLFCDDLALFY